MKLADLDFTTHNYSTATFSKGDYSSKIVFNHITKTANITVTISENVEVDINGLTSERLAEIVAMGDIEFDIFINNVDFERFQLGRYKENYDAAVQSLIEQGGVNPQLEAEIASMAKEYGKMLRKHEKEIRTLKAK